MLDSIQVTKKALKESMKENSDGLYRIYEERILDNTADELLLKAMGEQFINTQITKTALIAQSEFNRLASLSNQGSPNPIAHFCLHSCLQCLHTFMVLGLGSAIMFSSFIFDTIKLF